MASFYKSTTPTHVFDFTKSEINPADFKDIQVVYKQKDDIILEKHKADLTINGKKVSYKMTVEETEKFIGDESTMVQLMITVDDNTVYASRIYCVRVNEVLKEV